MEASPPPRKSRPAPAEFETSLESLPSEVHERIVSFLPIRDAVRTSAVARAWRRIWESAPGLAHDWGNEYGADPAHADAVLARYTRPVRSFFFCLPEGSFQRADDWVPLLAGKGVQILRLHFSRGGYVEPPHYMDVSIFSCRELTYLDLIGCDIPAAPVGLSGFPNLTKLYLHEVGFPDNGVRGLEVMITESPLLQLLWLDKLWFPEDADAEVNGHGFEEWVIRAPNLRDLRVISEIDNGWQIEELPYIEEVEVSSENYTTNRDFVRLLTRVARVQNLSLKMPLRENSALEGLSCSFENLKSL
ncbi:unnamed protein product [Urochloa humidicola]